MWLFLQSAIWTALGWIFRSVLVKFVVAFGMFFIVKILAEVISYALPNMLNLSSLIAAVPSGVWYYASLLQLQYGLPLIVSACISRFLIRRLPIIG
jgi:hypothetical protein